MDFAWTPAQQDFRATVRAFLAANLPDNWEELAHGPGSAAQTVFSKQFCGALAAAGLLVPHWPARWGGRASRGCGWTPCPTAPASPWRRSLTSAGTDRGER